MERNSATLGTEQENGIQTTSDVSSPLEPPAEALSRGSKETNDRFATVGASTFNNTKGAPTQNTTCKSPTVDANKRLSLLPQEDTWDISIMEKKHSGKRHKAREPLYTVYVTTPVASLTLLRTRTQIQDLDQQLHTAFNLPEPSPVRLLGLDDGAASPPRKRRAPFFDTISRTLSPNRYRRAAPKTSPQTMEAVFGDEVGETAEHLPTAQVAFYLTNIAKEHKLKAFAPWEGFFTPGPNDLQSHRLERRVRQIRSDPAMKIGTETASIGSSDARRDSDANSIAAMAALHQAFIDSAQVPDIDEFEVPPSALKKALKANGQLPTPLTTPVKVQPNVFFDDVQQEDNRHIHLPVRPATCDPPHHQAETKLIDIPTPELPPEEAPAADLGEALVAPEPKRPRKKVERKVSVRDFEILRVLGKGCAGKVMLVRHHRSSKLYAMKSIHKYHVLAHRELLHTLTEQSVLKRVAQDCDNPFVVRLWWSFHNKENLFLVLDFHPGGDLATQLARWGRLGRDRTRFYCAEIAEGLEGLHGAGVIYRDLKPENVLIAIDGHIVLTDFGLSKQFDRPTHRHRTSSDLPMHTEEFTVSPSWLQEHQLSSPPSPRHWQDQRETTTTFCGTAEYLAPEVLLGDPYSYECDAWSYGMMLYEMLTGMTPFWADNHTNMYRRVLHEELTFEEDDRNLDSDTKSILRGLLQKNPAFRMTDSRIKRHPYFSMIDWEYVRTKRYIAPFIPSVNPDDELDTSNFDDAFLSMPAEVADAIEEPVEEEEEDKEKEKGEPQSEIDENGRDVFEGYSFGGNDAESINVMEDELHVATEEAAPVITDAHVRHHPADLSANSLDHDHLRPDPPAKDEDAMSCSDRSVSTRLTNADRDIYMGVSGHSTEPSTATSEAHGKEASADMDSTKPDQPLEAATPSQEIIEPVAEIPEDEDWDVVEQEIQVAQNGRTVEGRRGLGKTLFQKGVPDRYVLAVKDAVRPTPKRTASSRQKVPIMTRSHSSRSSSIEDSSGADSPGQSRRKVFKLPRNSSTGQIAALAPGQRLPIRMRFNMGRATKQHSKNSPSQLSLERTDPPSTSSDRTASPAPVQRSRDEESTRSSGSTPESNTFFGVIKRNVTRA